MGLDLVEFTLVVEDTFQIAIPDEEAERILTPGQLVDYLLKRVGEAEDRACLEQRAFYRLRAAAIRVFHVPRQSVKPSTSWKELMPPRHVRRNWHLLQSAAAMPRWPKLSIFGRIKRDVATVGDLSKYLATYAPATFRETSRLTRGDVERTITRLMQDQFAISSFGWDQEFVRDLKLD